MGCLVMCCATISPSCWPLRLLPVWVELGEILFTCRVGAALNSAARHRPCRFLVQLLGAVDSGGAIQPFPALLLLRRTFLFVVGIAGLVELFQTLLAFVGWLLATVMLERLIEALVPRFGRAAQERQQQACQRNGGKADALGICHLANFRRNGYGMIGAFPPRGGDWLPGRYGNHGSR